MNTWVSIMNLILEMGIININKDFISFYIEDYKNSATDEEKKIILNKFISSIWSSTNKRVVYTKKITFDVRPELLKSDIGKLLNKYSQINYTGYKSYINSGNWNDIIRQKINNLYTIYFDKNVVTTREYMNVITTPKKIYLNWVNGKEYTYDEIFQIINNKKVEYKDIEKKTINRKMNLLWGEYKLLINSILERCLKNVKLFTEIDATDMQFRILYDTVNYEENFYVSYICRCLDCEIKKYQKKYFGLRDHKKYKHCKDCGVLIEVTNNKKLYCDHCSRERQLKRYKLYNKKRTTNRKVEKS